MMAYMAQFRPQGETEEDERLRRRAEDYHGGRVRAICTGYAFDPPWANPEEFHRRREEVVQQEEERYRAELARHRGGHTQRDRRGASVAAQRVGINILPWRYTYRLEVDMGEQVTQAESLAVGDKVRFLSGPFVGEEATVHTVRGSYLGDRMVWVTRDTGELSGGWFPNRFTKVAPAWVPKYAVRDRVRVGSKEGVIAAIVNHGYSVLLDGRNDPLWYGESVLKKLPDTEYNGLRVGDRVRLVKQAHSYHGKLGTITEFVPAVQDAMPHRGITFRWARVRLDGHAVDTGWLATELEKLTPEREKEESNMTTSAPKSTAPMSFQTAAQELQRLIQAGLKGGVVRQRSWDTKGLYAGIDIGGTSLYTPEKVAEYIAAQTPIDVVGKLHAYHKGCYEFLAPGLQRFIMSPRSYNYWTPEDIQKTKGLATQEGKTYRLCRNQPVPLYTPEKS
jgi:hypothetical protein